EVKSLVEKPEPGTQPSNLASMGRYLYTSDIFREVERLLPEYTDRELYQTPPLNELAARGKVAAIVHEGLRLDLGEPFAFLRAVTVCGLRRKEYSGAYLSFLRRVVRIMEEEKKDPWQRIAELM
ncbi:MAG: hypothetical protein DRG82_14500, partial [Deltaproteobacteria bacterium]